MSTNRMNPSDIKNLRNQIIARVFEPFGNFTASDEELVSGTWVPPVDVAEVQDRIIVRAELPGMKREDIQIEFENGLLTIRGERKLEKDNAGLSYHRVERQYGNFIRTFTLPRTVDPERITASYKDGVLELDVPKKEEAKPKQIRIEVNK